MMKKITSAFILILMLIASTQLQAQGEDHKLKVKAAFIYNFLNYFEWPNEENIEEFNIGIYSDQVEVLDKLRMHLRSKRFKESTFIRFHLIKSYEEVHAMHLIYFDKSSGVEIKEMYEAIGGRPILMVAENYPFGHSMINFIETNNLPKFEMNLIECKRVGLKPRDALVEKAIQSEAEWNTLLEKVEMIAKSDKEKVEINTTDLSRLVEEQKRLLADINVKKLELEYQNEQYEQQKKEIEQRQEQLNKIEQEFKVSKAALKENFAKIETQNSTIDEQSSKIENQELIIWLGIIFIIITTVLGSWAYRSYSQKNRANKIIQTQKREVEEQKEQISNQHELLEQTHKEIKDSIIYAERLQGAILPSVTEILDSLPKSFIFFKPKDVVSGDFYWFEQRENINFIAVADCTGHGVPGAMTSVVCSNSLNRCLNEFNLSEPSQILDKARELIIETFTKSGHKVMDGMDISLCALDLKTKMLKWSGANTPLWIIRENASEIEEKKATKQPVGLYSEMGAFDQHNIQLNENDAFYLFSDGYADQFGGPKGKKYKLSRFREKLIKIFQEPMESQKRLLKAEFEEWQGPYEQLDDVCLVGVRV